MARAIEPRPRLYGLINTLCDIAHGTPELLSLQASARANPIRRAIASRDSPRLFDWLMRTFSYQGLSDRAVDEYIARNGNATFAAIERQLNRAECDKLQGFWSFKGCGYEKLSRKCSCRSLLNQCPLPELPLRNGRLNQLAFSLYFFIRDVAGGDLVSYLDEAVAGVSEHATSRSVHAALIPPWRSVFGISDKVIAMALTTLLMSAPRQKKGWASAGQRLIVVDSLVHNFLHRTGALSSLGTMHPYGARCYAPGGCFDVLDILARGVDARRFDRGFPAQFPRFIQLAIWRYCAQSAWNVCNGNQIDDRRRCGDRGCYLHEGCRRRLLNGQKA